jgi:4-hydroxybenzoate polyprenyltransferase
MTRMNTRKLHAVLTLTRINRPIGTLLILWPALSALMLATQGRAPLYLWLIIIIGDFLVRSAGCCVNDFFDRNFDGQVARTKNRPLATGELSSTAAIIIAGILFAFALALAATLNYFTWFICIITFALICCYPLAKRFIAAPQIILGLTFNMGIIIAYTASTNAIPSTAWIFYIANLFFTLAYDTQYAIVDRKYDSKIKIHSTALLFGKYSNQFIVACEIIAIFLLLAVGVINKMHMPYYAGIVIATIYIINQIRKMPTSSDEKYFSYFMQHNIILFWIMLGIALNYYLDF